jgi:hypothetical protein
MQVDALPKDSYTTIRVQWNENRSFCDEWEGDHLTLIGRVWYLTEGINYVDAKTLADSIDSFTPVSVPPATILKEALDSGGYLPVDGAAPWVVTPEDLQQVAERYSVDLSSSNN